MSSKPTDTKNSMRPTTRLYLIISLVLMAIGLIFLTGLYRPANLPIVHVIFPVGAIFMGMFLVSWILDRETGEYDSEQAASLARADSQSTSKRTNYR